MQISSRIYRCSIFECSPFHPACNCIRYCELHCKFVMHECDSLWCHGHGDVRCNGRLLSIILSHLYSAHDVSWSHSSPIYTTLGPPVLRKPSNDIRIFCFGPAHLEKRTFSYEFSTCFIDYVPLSNKVTHVGNGLWRLHVPKFQADQTVVSGSAVKMRTTTLPPSLVQLISYPFHKFRAISGG